MPWNIPLFDSTGKIKDARVNPVFPVQTVWADFISMRGGSEPTDDYFWNKPVYPTTGDSYATITALNTALLTASAGAKLILDDGAHDGNILIPGDRTGLTVASETKGGAVLDDDNEIQIDGDDNVLMGFKQAQLDINGDNNLIAYHQINNSTAVDKIYAVIDGHRNRLCYSELENSEVQLFNISNTGGPQTYNRVDHNHLLNHLGGRSGASEICQIGQAQQGVDYFALIDSNYILAHDPNAFTEGECISNKSGSNSFIHNVFIDCLATLNDRAATDSMWYANFVNGGGLALSSGFKIQLRCIFACNIIIDINGSDLGGRAALDFSKGGINNHQPADNAEASFNTIYNSFRCIGFGNKGLGTDLATDPSLYGNAVLNADAGRDSIWIQDFDGTLTTSGNVLDPPVGIAQGGIVAEVPDLSIVNDVPVPDASGNCDQARTTTGYNSIITVDFLGNPIAGSNQNTGAIQPGYNLSSSPITQTINESGVNA